MIETLIVLAISAVVIFLVLRSIRKDQNSPFLQTGGRREDRPTEKTEVTPE